MSGCALVDFVAEGYGTVGADTPVNEAYRYYAAIEPRSPDIEQARALLAEAGYPDGLDVTLIASDRPGTRTQLAVAFRQMAAPAGFRIEVQTMPHSTYLDQVWRQGNFYVGFYNMQATADAIFSLLFTSDAPWNETRWNNPEFDALIEEARRTPDGPERAEIYAEAQRMMADEVPAVIPVYFDLRAAHRDHVEGFNLHPRGAVFQLHEVWLNT
jgi:peptide/nickel transport system substrate-binding protein